MQIVYGTSPLLCLLEMSSPRACELDLFRMLVSNRDSTRVVFTVLVQIYPLGSNTRVKLTLKAVITNMKMKIFNLK